MVFNVFSTVQNAVSVSCIIRGTRAIAAVKLNCTLLFIHIFQCNAGRINRFVKYIMAEASVAAKITFSYQY